MAGRLIDRLQARFIVDTDPPSNGLARPLTVLGDAAPSTRPLLRDAALIVFTSGTTGQPKGAVLSHAAISGKLAANNTLLHFGPTTRTLLVLQITFSFGMWVSLLTLTRGGWLHLEEKFAAPEFLAALARQRITDVALVPTMIRSLFASSGDSEMQRQVTELGGLRHLRRLLAGGENLGATLGQRLRALVPHADLIDIYGLTETATCDFFLLPPDQVRYSGCIGRPGPSIAFRVADDQGRAVAAGEPGELQIRTPYLMNGYLDAPDLTAQALRDGYFRTGDIARERDPGVVELLGRSKELISRGANKVSPLEIEQVLAGHPAVAEALATGVPDAVLGERIHALIVLRGGATATVEELGAWAAERLDRYKCPDRIHFGTELPLGPTGKSDRNHLRELLSHR